MPIYEYQAITPDRSCACDAGPSKGGAEYGAPAALPTIQDPDLRRLIAAWPDLPEAVHRGILAMVAAFTGEGA